MISILVCLAGCGGGGSTSGGSTGSGSSNSSNSAPIPGPNPQMVGRIVINSVLARTIPNSIDTLVFRGLDAQGTLVYGPISQAKVATILLENVPLSVRTLEIDYLQAGVVRGRASQGVQVVAGQDTQIQDVNFSDVTYALTQIQLDPPSLEMRRGQTAPLRVQGHYADNTSGDLTDATAWTSSNTSVAESIGGTVVARGVGNCTITAVVGSLNSQASVRVTRPLLQGLQISPVNATLLEGGELAYSVVGQFEDGSQETLSDATWSSNPGSLVSISAQGLAHAQAPGDCLIQASRDGFTANTTLTVAVNETLANLQVTPAQFQVPKGMTLSYTAQASYANGTTADVTSITTFAAEDANVAQAPIPFPVQIQPAALPVVVLANNSLLSLKPPPYFPALPNQVRAVGLGMTRIFATFQSLTAEAWLTVVQAVPFEARVNPIQTHLLEVGGQLQLETLTALTDGTQETNRADIGINVQGSSTAVNGQRLLIANQPGTDRVQAVVPPLPQLPGGAHYQYLFSPYSIHSDYFTPPYEETVVVVNQPLGLTFAAEAERPGIGTILENSPFGLIGVQSDHLLGGGFGPPSNTPNTTGITALAAGNFTNGSTRQIFFAGSRWGSPGADYAVAVTTAGTTFPFTLPTTTYTEFRDGPVSDAVVADFNGDGKSDAALLIENQLLVRLTGATPLSQLKSTTGLGFAGKQLAQGDFNEDGQIDLVVGAPGGLQILLGDADGNFASRPLVAATSVTNHLTVGDIDGDHHLDVTYMNSEGFGNRNWVVAFGDGQGGLGRMRNGTTGYRVAATALADMTGDGRADLVTVQSKSQATLAHDADVSVSIHPGSSGGFLPQQVIQVSSARSGSDLVVRDANSDGRLDITLALTQPASSPSLGGTIYNRSSNLVNLLRQP